MKRIFTIFIITALCLTSANGTVLNVPADYPTIQDAITAAAAGDTIRVAAGTYQENVVVEFKPGITLIGDGADVTTILGIDGRVFTAWGTSDVELDGFTITGGNIGGIYCSSSTMTVRNCVITNNVATTGGGINCINGTMLILDSVIEGNQASSLGGGIYFSDSSQSVIGNCSIIGNDSGVYGGGIHIDGYSGPVIISTEIRNNSAGRDGGGINCKGDLLLIGSLVSDNAAGGYGGGMAFSFGAEYLVANSEISRNSAQRGGGIYSTSSWTSLQNCTIVYNSAPSTGGVLLTYGDPQDSVDACVIWGNGIDLIGEGAYQCCIENGDMGSESIADDPLFVNVSDGNYRLSMLSPCINPRIAAWLLILPEYVPLELRLQANTDLDGNTRIVNSWMDIGAYEYQGSIAVSPMQHDFGDVEGGTEATAIMNVTSLRKTGDVQLSSINILNVSSLTGFSITAPDVMPDALGPGESFEVELTFSPEVGYEGYYTGYLAITSYDGAPEMPPHVPVYDWLRIPLGGMGVITELPPEEQVEAIQDDIDEGLEDGTIVGEGSGNSADKKINALSNMLDAVGDLILAEEYELAYTQLESLYKKIDGQPKPPDFVTGEGVADLRLQVETLLEDLLLILSQP